MCGLSWKIMEDHMTTGVYFMEHSTNMEVYNGKSILNTLYNVFP